MSVTESEKLELAIAATIKFGFGTMCDRADSKLKSRSKKLSSLIVNRLIMAGLIGMSDSEEALEHIENELKNDAHSATIALQREIRDQGNDALRIVLNHLQHYKVLRRHSADKPNAERIAKAHERRSTDGN